MAIVVSPVIWRWACAALRAEGWIQASWVPVMRGGGVGGGAVLELGAAGAADERVVVGGSACSRPAIVECELAVGSVVGPGGLRSGARRKQAAMSIHSSPRGADQCVRSSQRASSAITSTSAWPRSVSSRSTRGGSERWRRRIEQALLGHACQARLERAGRDARQPAAQRVEPQRAGGEVADDHHQPAVADDAQRSCVRRPLAAWLVVAGIWVAACRPPVRPPARRTKRRQATVPEAGPRRLLPAHSRDQKRSALQILRRTIPKSHNMTIGYRGLDNRRAEPAKPRSAARRARRAGRRRS